MDALSLEVDALHDVDTGGGEVLAEGVKASRGRVERERDGDVAFVVVSVDGNDTVGQADRRADCLLRKVATELGLISAGGVQGAAVARLSC